MAIVENRTALISPENPNKNIPLAFNLAKEFYYIQAFGENYKPFFYDQVNFFLKETYGKVRLSDIYEHDINKDYLGNPFLYITRMEKKARASYQEPINDLTKPDWYRERARKDDKVIEGLEDKLRNAQDGDIFIDCSPTEFNVDINERKKYQFGWHSFVRFHQVIKENGQQKIISRALRNYLNLNQQASLFNRLTGKSAEESQLFGIIEKLKPEFEFSSIEKDNNFVDIQRLIEQLNEETPISERIVPPLGEDKFYQDQNKVNLNLEQLRPMIDLVFYRLLKGPQKMETKAEFGASLTELFHAVEMALQAKLSGNISQRFEDDLKYINAEADILTNNYLRNQMVAYYIQDGRKNYRPTGGNCGSGSGFDIDSIINNDLPQSAIDRISGNMNYQGLSGDKYGPLPFICPVCNQEHIRKRNEMMRECPNRKDKRGNPIPIPKC